MFTGNQRFASLAEALTSGILTAGDDGEVDYANPAARELFWRTDADLLGRGWLDCVNPEERAEVEACVEKVRAEGNAALEEFRLDVLGHTRWVRARFNSIDGQGGRGWVAVFDDITTDRATSDDLARRATHDALTGLPNRTLLHDRLGRAIARSRRHAGPLAVLFLDLDRFKPVNDRLGHRAGDQALREIGRRLRTTIRAEDTAARLGGDEFVVIAEGVTREAAGKVAGRLADAIAAPMSIEGEQVVLTASIGVMWCSHTDLEPLALIDLSDRAMYHAKRTASAVAFAPESD